MAGDNLVRPLNAPPGVPGSPGVQPGVSGGVVIANKVIVFGTGDGVFVYSGTPGKGNPPVAWVSGALTDPYGNSLPAEGIVSSGSGQFSQLFDGLVKIVSSAGSCAFSIGEDGELIVTGTDGIALSNATETGPLPVLSTFPLTATDPAQLALGNIVAETWHDVGAASGFTVSTVQRYKLFPDNTAHIQFSLASTNTAGTYTLFTLPAGYVPAVQYDGPAPGIFNTTATFSAGLLNTRFRVTTAGAVQIVSLPGTAVNNVSGYYVVPLD
jgi:hypothetical protein